MSDQEQERQHAYEDKIETYHAFLVGLRYVILVHVAAAVIAICWLAGAAIGWGIVLAMIIFAAGIAVIGPFKADARHPALADPPFHTVKP